MFTAIDFDEEWYERSKQAIAQGALTNSKRAECLVKGVYPTHLTRGNGCHVWDIHGRKFTDFICGLGANILGYGHPEVADTIARRALSGCTLSLSTDLEVIVAEKVKEIFPFVERLKFLKTGSEACTAALRIARAATNRQLVYSEGYHGWNDEFVSMTPPAHGVTQHYLIQKLPQDISQIDRGAAAVILEPVMLDRGRDRLEWLRDLREYCTENGIVLIFDEIITGFRYPKFSVANCYGITPDLICLGKAMANGMPISVVGGKQGLMESSEYFVSSTFAGEAVSLAAALKTMTLLQTKYLIQDLWDRGEQFLKAFNALTGGKLTIAGYPTRGAFQGDPLLKALFWQESCRAGILFGPSWFINHHHIPLFDAVLSTSRDILVRIAAGEVELKGEMPSSPFAAKMRGQA